MARALTKPDRKHTGRDSSDKPDSAEENFAQSGARYDFLTMVAVAETRDQAFKAAIQRTAWQRAYAAFHNRHAGDSKYSDAKFNRKRSSIYRPKTRSAVRKNMAAAAASLFQTADAVSVSAEVDNDPVKLASASVLQELLNYRLDRTATKSGVPWFLVASGAHLDTQITGICFSKQFWEYEVIDEPRTELVREMEVYEDDGTPVLDEATGEPKITERYEERTESFTTKDRPMSQNIPPDNVMLDQSAYWINPCQSSAYLVLKFPMTLDAARTMLTQPGKSGEQWLTISDAMLRQCASEYTAKGVRIERSPQRTDAQDNDSGGASDENTAIVWLYECFYRIAGVDWHFWTLGSRYYVSAVRTTRQAYPDQRGERPVVGGYAAVETHETSPMAPVMQWHEMQKELNDIVNLRLDTMKQALSPIAKVKQGSTFDFKQLHNRAGQDTTIIVRQMDDLEFDRSPDVNPSAYQETNLLNADFDDLAGIFSGSSVQTNRSLNETVGGMRLLNNSANAVTEFDIRVFIETWVEPTLRQIVRLEQYYENDDIVLAIAGQRAKLERFGVDQLQDTDLEHEVSVKVNVGLGSADPVAKLTRLASSLELLGRMVPFMDKQVRVNSEAMIKEVMGPAGYTDGLRLFVLSDRPSQTPEAMLEEMKLQLQQLQIQNDAQMNDKDNQTDMAIARLQEQGKIIAALLKEVMNLHGQQQQLQHENRLNARQVGAGIFNTERSNRSREMMSATKQPSRPQ